MIFFGHIGITVGIVHFINCKTQRRVDLRKAAALGVAPDFLDKPVALLYPNVFENHTRLLAHSLLFSFVLLILFWLVRRKHRDFLILWGAYFGHLLLDRTWEKNLYWFAWPFWESFKPEVSNIFLRWYHALFLPYSLFGEITGLMILTFLFLKYQLYKPDRFGGFLKTGLLLIRDVDFANRSR